MPLGASEVTNADIRCSAWFGSLPISEGCELNMVKPNLTLEQKEALIAYLKVQPEWNPSNLILLDETDVPDDLRGRVRFRIEGTESYIHA
jgi:hypothetical protein